MAAEGAADGGEGLAEDSAAAEVQEAEGLVDSAAGGREAAVLEGNGNVYEVIYCGD